MDNYDLQQAYMQCDHLQAAWDKAKARVADLERQLAAGAAGPWSTDMDAAPRGVDLLTYTKGDICAPVTYTTRDEWDDDEWYDLFEAWVELRMPEVE